MPRRARDKSVSGFYHIIQRGIGKQIIFEEKSDYIYFLRLLARYKTEEKFELHAFCLMDNHFHLLIRTSEELGPLMKKIGSEYAIYYNKKYGRTGHLFQDRFKSEVVDSREYYFTVIRYIINNPANAGIATPENYIWSSYSDYLGQSKLTDTRLLLSMIGGVQAFKRFIYECDSSKNKAKCLDVNYNCSINDVLAKRIIKRELGFESGTELQNLDKGSRDFAIIKLYSNGLSARQIERLTGISRSIVARIIRLF